jgi:NAD(P)-dependent dehydrogenase (short-subunit alcohol dehydrogenase family)
MFLKETNHYGPALFTELLVDFLAKAEGARIIHTSSIAHKWANNGVLDFDDLVRPGKAYQAFPHAYGTSKLMQILYAFECQRVWGESKKISSFSFHPGFVSSHLGWDTMIGKIIRTSMVPFQRTQDQGASTALYCALADQALEHAGGYFVDNAHVELAPEVLDAERAQRLRELTLKVTGLMEDESIQVTTENAS